MRIAVIGTGYVGLVSGTCFAETGNHVTCVDIDEEKVNKLNAGHITIYEPDLEVIFQRNLEDNRLSFTTDLKSAVQDALLIFLALPTPAGGDGSADLSYVLNVSEELGKIIDDYKVIVDKSTVPVGTADKVKEKIALNYKGDFDVVSNPEFLREGVAVEDFMKPDRVIIGTTSSRAKEILHELYNPYVRQGNPIVFMDERSAELTKYAANSFLATKISFMNEIANICDNLGADVDKVRMGMSYDSRIGNRFLFPGIGYGGSCFPKDVKALINSSKSVNYNFEILNAVSTINEKQKTILLPKIKHHFNDLSGLKFAIWGLAFKPNTDDIREAPALYIIEELLKENASVAAYDPEAMENVRKHIGDKISYGTSIYDISKDADALIICTEWPEFRVPEFEKIKDMMKQNIIFDGRNVFDVQKMKKLGFTYYSIGRNTAPHES